MSQSPGGFWRAGRGGVLLRFLGFAAFFAAMGFLSVALGDAAGIHIGFGLSNAFLMASIIARPGRSVAERAAAYGLGTVAIGLIHGHGSLLAIGFTLVNAGEVLSGVALYLAALGSERPHARGEAYIRFLSVVVLTSAMSGLLGATLLRAAFGADWQAAFSVWSVASAVSLTAFVPFFLWFCRPSRSEYRFRATQIFWTLGCLAVLLCHVYLTMRSSEDLRGFFAIVVLFAVFSLRMGRLGTMLTTALWALLETRTSFMAETLPAPYGVTGPGMDLWSFVLVFFSVSLPANLIAATIGHLRIFAEEQHRISELRGEFMSTMSHETLTPINVISGVLQILERRTSAPRDRELLAGATQAVRSLSHQSQQFLTMARLNDNRLDLSLSRVDVEDMMNRWCTMLEAEIVSETRDLTVERTGPVLGGAHVWADAERLGQILLNLGSNAVKFSEAGAIRIETRDVGRHIVFVISDDGPGLNEEARAHVFDRFWRADLGPARRTGGSGIGLAICLELAKAMQGDLRVAPGDGKGACFELTLPKAG